MIPFIITSVIFLAFICYISKLLKGASKQDEYIELLRTKRGQNTVKDRTWRDL